MLLLVGCTQPPADVVAANATVQRKVWQKTPTTAIAKLQTSPQSQATTQLPTKTTAWVWPAKGNTALALKGLDIVGYEGAPVVAANDGEVVYSGDSLRGYGNLIIIKHSKYFISAYAHNRKNMVKEGEHVKMGQKIAEMGQSGTDKVKLHFEVRYKGKPINPQEVLPANR